MDDSLAINYDEEAGLYKLGRYFIMKKELIRDPDIYLGANMRKVKIDKGVWVWFLSPSKYIQDAVSNVKDYLITECGGNNLKKKSSDHWLHDYASELDDSPGLYHLEANYYQSQVRLFHCMV